MRMPSFKRLKAETEREGFCTRFSGTFRHPNPRLYKYYWWVFWEGSPCDGSQFLSDDNRMPTKQAFDLMDSLTAQSKSYWVYNRRLPRRDPANPFNPDAEKWRDEEWAPSFDEDTDDAVNGFK